MKISKLRIVLDTNILLVSLPTHSKYHWVFEGLLKEDFDLLVSNEILTEYAEQIIQRYGLAETEAQLDFLVLLPNVQLINPSFRWHLIHQDPDDNKFVDCAIAANADFIVTHDKHFRVLDAVTFPPIQVITLDQFEQRLKAM